VLRYLRCTAAITQQKLVPKGSNLAVYSATEGNIGRRIA
jgi:hypothetical protein